MFLLGLDVGTTGAKAIIFNIKGEIIGTGFREYGIVSKKERYAEQNPEEVFVIVKNVIKEALENAKVDRIEALSLSVQGDAIIPVDNKGFALYPAILGMDYRSEEETKYCSHVFGDYEIYKKTGMRPHPMNSLTKMLWLKNNVPEIYERASKIVTYADFIMMKLGSSPKIDYTMASRTMAFNLESKQWDETILKKLEIDVMKLSDPVESGTIIGTLNKEIKKELGLINEVKLVAGGHDQTCAALGSGVIKEGLALDSHGTAEVLSVAFEERNISHQMYDSFYPCYYHVVPHTYFSFALNHIGGILFKWFRDEFCQNEVSEAEKKGKNAYELLLQDINQEPGSVYCLPHFNGSGTPYCDLKSKGAFIGLTMATQKSDLVKSIIESLTYELCVNIENMEEIGISISNIRCVGGAARSEKWLQIKADITGKNVETLEVREAACLGAAILAGVASNIYKDVFVAVENTVHVKRTFIPNIKLHKRYIKKYEYYKKLYEMLKEFNHNI